jgi:ketosteroid isomerase-like protein
MSSRYYYGRKVASMDEAKAIQEVIATERRWVEAHRQLNLEALAEIMANDYVQIRSDGSLIGKSQALASYASQTRQWDHADSDQYQINIYGDTAILIGRWIGRGKNAQETFDYTARFLAVYVKTTSGWKLAADQSTLVDDYQEG